YLQRSLIEESNVWRPPSRVHQQHLIVYSFAEGEAQLPAPDDMEELQFLRLPLPLLRIQKFRRPIRISVRRSNSDQQGGNCAYDLIETDEEEDDDAEGGGEVIETSGCHFGGGADISLPSSDLSASLPLSSPIHHPQIDPLAMEPPIAASSAQAMSLLHPFDSIAHSGGSDGLGELYSIHTGIAAGYPAFLSMGRAPYYDVVSTGDPAAAAAIHDVMFGAVGGGEQQQPMLSNSNAVAVAMYSHPNIAADMPPAEYLDTFYGFQQQQPTQQMPQQQQQQARVFYEEQRVLLPFPLELPHPLVTTSSAAHVPRNADPSSSQENAS
ncbi:hypothetical protein IWW38_006231, partial [Coemansia aciculifera]